MNQLWALLPAALVSVSAAASADDLPQFATGLKFLDAGAYQSIPLAAPRFSGPLPSRVQLAHLPPAGDQGAQSSCVGWAVAYALKTQQEGAERRWDVALKTHEFSPAFIYDQIKPAGNCSVGTLYVDALNLVTRDGAAPLSVFPYDPTRCDARPDNVAKQAAAQYRIATWRRVNTLDETEVKTHLAAGFAVLIGMPVDKAFAQLKGASVYQGLLGPPLGGHAMVTVGYDDDKAAFRLMNSWGVGWGEGGMGWISYTAFRQTVREGYVTQDIVEAAPPPAAVAETQLEFETRILAETPMGVKAVTKTTANHHCEHNCEGEPTRTNYRLEIDAGASDTIFRNPRLRCIGGPCQGWNGVLFARLEEGGRKAVASWDVWAHPTTWELSVDEFRMTEVSRFVRRVPLGSAFSVLAETGGPRPHVSGKLSTGEAFNFEAGRPTLNRFIRFVGAEVQGPETVYRYETSIP